MFTIQTVTHLKWADAEHTMFSCNVKYAEFNEIHPSGINATDTYEHIHTIWVNALAGQYGVIAEYVAPEPLPPAPQDQQPVTTGIQTV